MDSLRELLHRIKNRFNAEGIEIPFPHRTVYLGTGQSESTQLETRNATFLP